MISSAEKINHISEDSIRQLVDAFYVKVRLDPELAPIFADAIPGDWQPHLSKMYAFWSSVMLTTGRYKGNPSSSTSSFQVFARTCSSAGWLSSMKPAESCSMRESVNNFALRLRVSPRA